MDTMGATRRKVAAGRKKKKKERRSGRRMWWWGVEEEGWRGLQIRVGLVEHNYIGAAAAAAVPS